MKLTNTQLIIGGLVIAFASAMITYHSLDKVEPTSGLSGKPPRQRWFESWEHYKGRLMEWYRENN